MRTAELLRLHDNMPDSSMDGSIISIGPSSGPCQRALDEVHEFALKYPHRIAWSPTIKRSLPVWPRITVKMKRTQNRLGGDVTYVLIVYCDADDPIQAGCLLLSVDGTCLTDKNALSVIDSYSGRRNVEITYQTPMSVTIPPKKLRPSPPPVDPQPPQPTCTLHTAVTIPRGTVELMSIELQARELESALAAAMLDDMTWRPLQRVIIQYVGAVDPNSPSARPGALLGIPARADELVLLQAKAFCRLYSTHLVVDSQGSSTFKRNDLHCLPNGRRPGGSYSVATTAFATMPVAGSVTAAPPPPSRCFCPSIDAEAVQRVAANLVRGYSLASSFPELATYLLMDKDWMCGALSSKDVGIQLRHGCAGRYVHVDVLAIDDHELVSTYAPALYSSGAVYVLAFSAGQLPHVGARLAETLSEIAACCSAAAAAAASGAPEAHAPAVVLYACGAESMSRRQLRHLDEQLAEALQPLCGTALARRCRLLRPGARPDGDGNGDAGDADDEGRPMLLSSSPAVASCQLLHATCAQVARAVTAELLSTPSHDGLSPPRRHKLACTLVAKLLHGRHGCLSRMQVLDSLRYALPPFAKLSAAMRADIEQDVLAYLHECGLALVPDEMGLATLDPGRGVDGFVLLQPLDLLDFVDACAMPMNQRRLVLDGLAAGASAAQAWREFETAGVLRRSLLDVILKRDDRPHVLHFYERLHVMLPLHDGCYIVPSHCPLLHQSMGDFTGPMLHVDFGHCLPVRLLLHVLWRLQRECDPMPATASSPALPVVDYARRCGAYKMHGCCFLLRSFDRQYGRLEIRLRGSTWDTADLISVYARLLRTLRRLLPDGVLFKLGPACPLLESGCCLGPAHHVIDLSEAGPCGQALYCGMTRVDLDAKVSRWLYETPEAGVPDIPATMNYVLLRDIPEAVCYVICEGLNRDNALNRNWRRLAAAVSIYTMSEAEQIEMDCNPTRSIITDLAQRQPHRTVGDLLRTIQEQLQRNDVIEDVLRLGAHAGASPNSALCARSEP